MHSSICIIKFLINKISFCNSYSIQGSNSNLLQGFSFHRPNFSQNLLHVSLQHKTKWFLSLLFYFNFSSFTRRSSNITMKDGIFWNHFLEKNLSTNLQRISQEPFCGIDHQKSRSSYKKKNITVPLNDYGRTTYINNAVATKCHKHKIKL